ncbi:FAD-binding oxidoreductase [Rubrolithibacter danxiaensis]|uniref:FAD-binding oxidoreductase n=1 Tax=Rubrolithibacter danxiaensis TaxID=3390805 RepID=UPI003BF78840
MKKHIVKVLKTGFITYNVKYFVVEKPSGYTFIPGQATDVSINTPELENELRPFTFTSLNGANHLEFIIKIYRGHNGITEKLLDINAGDELIIHEVFGAINYKGPGLFIAAGAGITPFIAIFRQLKSENRLTGNTLLFANRTENDIILKDELKEMLGQENNIDVLERINTSGLPGRLIDKELLKQSLTHQTEYCYICGPDDFTKAMVENLIELGVERDRIVIEE